MARTEPSSLNGKNKQASHGSNACSSISGNVEDSVVSEDESQSFRPQRRFSSQLSPLLMLLGAYKYISPSVHYKLWPWHGNMSKTENANQPLNFSFENSLPNSANFQLHEYIILNIYCLRIFFLRFLLH